MGKALQSTKAEWCIYTSVNWAIIDSDKGLVSVWRQAIIWTNAGLLSTEHILVKFKSKYKNFH